MYKRTNMKILILSTAGISSRFNTSLKSKKPVLKSIFYKDTPKHSLLGRFLEFHKYFDKIIIVGGFLFNELEATLKYFNTNNIDLIYNDKYNSLGSGYSLYLGLKKTLEYNFSEIIFSEGDLFVDKDNFLKIIKSPKDTISINNHDIYANKSVSLYINAKNHIKYIYDKSHNSLEILEPFTAIFNSAQIWKFSNTTKIRNIINKCQESIFKDTNLEFIQKYFSDVDINNCAIIKFKKWINCNTIDDFEKINFRG